MIDSLTFLQYEIGIFFLKKMVSAFSFHTHFFFLKAVEFAERKMLEKRQEEEDNVAEISSLLRGDLLSENPEQAASSFGRHRVITDRWKGMNQDQLKAIRYTQQQQVLEKLVFKPICLSVLVGVVA